MEVFPLLVLPLNMFSRFLGTSELPKGLLFVEASAGNLQAYLDRNNESISISCRMKWRTQAAEATQYTHAKGVIHSDLRPENYLLHADANGFLNLYLTDFGGWTCGEIDGGHLSDSGFFGFLILESHGSLHVLQIYSA